MKESDADSTELDKYIDEIIENAYQLGMTVGKDLDPPNRLR